MREREQQVVLQPEETRTDETQLPVLAGEPLDLLQRARNSEGSERLELASQLNVLLRSGAAQADRETWAQFLIDKLDDDGFHELYDSEGVSCRAVAVEALLTLGFPHALHLNPADLEYMRVAAPNRGAPGGWRAMAVVTGVLAALFALAFFIHL